MKLEDKNIQVSTDNNNYSEAKFGIGDLKIIFNILRSKLYSDPITSICREYASNARDAHTEAGTPEKPIEIYLPTILDPTFKVKDYGFGITPERMSNVFVLYGNSTKRDSNDQIGGFGIGAKVGFAYCEQFQITSITKNELNENIKRTYIAYIDESEIGALRLMTETKTEEHTGTEISISVKNNDFVLFKKGVIQSCSFWKVQPTVFGANFDVEVLYENDDFFLFKSSDFISNLIYIDGITYSLSPCHWTCYIKFALKFNIGELTLSANREALHYDDKTKQLINDKLSIYKGTIDSVVSELIESQKTYLDAIKAYANDYKGLAAEPRYKGKKLYYADYFYELKAKLPVGKVKPLGFDQKAIIVDKALPGYKNVIKNYCTKNPGTRFVTPSCIDGEEDFKKFEEQLKKTYNTEVSDFTNLILLSDIYNDYKPKRLPKGQKVAKEKVYKVITDTYKPCNVHCEKVSESQLPESFFIRTTLRPTGNEVLTIVDKLLERKVITKKLPVIYIDFGYEPPPNSQDLLKIVEDYQLPIAKAQYIADDIKIHNIIVSSSGNHVCINELNDLRPYLDKSIIVRNLNYLSSKECDELNDLKIKFQNLLKEFYPMIYVSQCLNRYSYNYGTKLSDFEKEYIKQMNYLHEINLAAE